MGQTENGKWWPFEHFLVAIVVEKSSQVVMVELQSVVVDNIVAGVEVVGYSLLALVAIAEPMRGRSYESKLVSTIVST